MTARAEYTDDEWQLLYLAPWVVGVAVALAERGGVLRELMTIASLSATVRERYPDDELMGALWATRQDPAIPAVPVPALEAKGPEANAFAAKEIEGALLDRALETCHRVVALLGERSSTAEAQDFRLLLGEVAIAVANTTRSGGVLGFGGVLVTPAERTAVDAIRSALDLEPMPGREGGISDGDAPPPPDQIRGGPGIPSGAVDPS
jgi:hypothetical protein